MTHQQRKHLEERNNSESVTQKIESMRNSIEVGKTLNSGLLGLTVTDRSLRKAQCLLDIESIDRLIEELRAARGQLEYEMMLAELHPKS